MLERKFNVCENKNNLKETTLVMAWGERYNSDAFLI